MTNGQGTAAAYEISVADVAYQRRDGRPLLARLYRPRGQGPFPAVVEVHGGAWSTGDRLNNAPLDAALAAAGIVVMAIDFRMPPAAPYPASIADVNLAIRWLKAHARQFGSDAALVGGLGTSSGGHQILLSALRPRDRRYAALPLPDAAGTDARLSWVVACWPIADPLARYRMARERGIDRLVQAHDAYWLTEAAMREGNPQLVLERGEAEELPPLLVVQGTGDDNVTPDMADRLVAAYRKAGGRAALEKYADQPHMFITRDPGAPASIAALAAIEGFVRDMAGAT